MMIELEGKKYLGIFGVSLFGRTVDIAPADMSYGSWKEETKYSYEGTGSIKRIFDNQIQRILISTREVYGKEISFSDSFLYFQTNSTGYASRVALPSNRIVKQEELIDFVLEQLFRDSENGKEPVVKVSPKALNLEEMIKKGLVTEESGQMSLGLGK